MAPPLVVDSLDIAAINKGNVDHNISLERVSTTAATQLSSNWEFNRAVSKTGVTYTGYLPGGTPGAVNTNSCPTGYGYHDGECLSGPELLVGTYNQKHFQDDWLTERYFSEAQTDGFRKGLQDGGAYLVFKRDLANNNVILELEDSDITADRPNENNIHNGIDHSNAQDANGLDAVDIAYIGTHGGESGTLALRNEGMRTSVTHMKLGDDARGLSLLALWACNTLYTDGKNNEIDRRERWENAFSGGLRYVVGFHGKHQRWITTDEDGKEFAKHLMSKDDLTILSAFRRSMSDWALDLVTELFSWIFDSQENEPTAAASGRNSSDCEKRLNRMTLDNMIGTERLRGNQIGAICFYDITY